MCFVSVGNVEDQWLHIIKLSNVQQSDKTILDKISSSWRIALAILFFMVGGAIYVSYRVKTLNMFGWFNFLGLDHYVDYLRSNIGTYKISNFVKYSLPDGLWLFSYFLVIKAIYNTEMSKAAIISYTALPLVAIGSEILQIFNLVPGVFDIYDLICYICSILIFFYLNTLRL